ncbi:MAG TPA: SIR2 family protein [Burkholderiales bacterium]|nr:SIR2 family protein [Burkholderiales bacterium]
MNAELIEAVRSRRTLLFVGAGVSRCLGLPDFAQLVSYVAEDLGYDAELFATHGDYLALAEYYVLEKGAIAPLQRWMERTWHAKTIDIRSSRIHDAIVDLDFPVIYTTNYDQWLERAHAARGKPYIKIANVGDIAKGHGNTTQIVKFHGDVEDQSSIVLSESSYFSRMDFESPLDIKLRADLLGRSVLYIGYSLSDINMRYMLYRLNRQWTSVGSEEARPKSYIFLTRPNPVQQRVLESRNIQPIVSDRDDPKEGLAEFLTSLLPAAATSIET